MNYPQPQVSNSTSNKNSHEIFLKPKKREEEEEILSIYYDLRCVMRLKLATKQ